MDIQKVKYKHLLIQLITLQIKHCAYITSTTRLLFHIVTIKFDARVP